MKRPVENFSKRRQRGVLQGSCPLLLPAFKLERPGARHGSWS